MPDLISQKTYHILISDLLSDVAESQAIRISYTGKMIKISFCHDVYASYGRSSCWTCFGKVVSPHMLSTLCSSPLAGDSKLDTGTLQIIFFV